MDEPIDNEQFDLKKKALEIKKLEKEIIKLEREGTELSWRKWSNWGAAIIAICSVAIVGLNGYLTDSKSKLVAEETKNQQAKNDTSRAIFRRDSLFLISQKNKIKKQLDSLEQKFIQDKIKFEKERVKYGYVISQKEKEISKVENCFPKAKEFLLQYCVITKVQSMSLDSVTSGINPPPYKTRFNKSLEEIANMDISNMDYIQFLIITANFKTIVNRFTNNIISEDKLANAITVVTDGAMTRVQGRREINDTASKFECYKGLSTNQKMKLLNEVTIRKN